MSLNILISNVVSPVDFTLYYKTGSTLGDHFTGFTQYSIGADSGVIYTGSTYRNYNTNPIIYTGASYETQYWFKFLYTGDTGDTGYIIENVYTNDYNYYVAIGCSPDCAMIGTVVVTTSTPTPTSTPTSTSTSTDTPSSTTTNTPTSSSTETPTPTDTETPGFTPTPTSTNTDTPSPTTTETPTSTSSSTETPTSTSTETPTEACLCNYFDVNIESYHFNSATGNTILYSGESTNDKVFVEYVSCEDSETILYTSYTSSGSYGNSFCSYTGNESYPYMFYFNTDVEIPVYGSSGAFNTLNPCCDVTPSPTSTPTSTSSSTETPTSSPTSTNTETPTSTETSTNTLTETPTCTNLPYSYTLYYLYNDGPCLIFGASNSNDACDLPEQITVYSTSSSFIVGTQLYCDSCGTTTIQADPYNQTQPYYNYNGNYVTFETDGFTVRSITPCLPAVTPTPTSTPTSSDLPAPPSPTETPTETPSIESTVTPSPTESPTITPTSTENCDMIGDVTVVIPEP